jgi:tight adherence protein B
MMTKAAEFDKQLADLVWSMSTALRAGYSLSQIFEMLASVSPEPTASSCGHVHDDLQHGISLDQALSNWLQSMPSINLGEVVATIQQQLQTGGNLALMLDPVGETILAVAGSDGAFFPAMRDLAQSVGAKLPPRAVAD